MDRLDYSSKISIFMFRVMLWIFAILMSVAFIFSAFVSYRKWLIILGAVMMIALFGVISFLAQKLGRFFEKAADWKNLLVLSAICLFIKLLWICFVTREPLDDYATFYYSAVRLSENWEISSRYIALFPHIMGYSTFLSIFMGLFGPSVFLATLLNVILSVLSGALIYAIVRKLISAPAAAVAYIFWILCPSQTVYNSLVLSEPLYTTFILAFVYLMVCIKDTEHNSRPVRMALFGALGGFLLRCINVNRPLAAIFVIALFIWLFVLRAKELKDKRHLFNWGLFLLVMLLVYSLLGTAWNQYFASRLGEEPASFPGYNVYVGFNAESNGTWNQEDADTLFSYSDKEGATADWAQRQMMEEAKTRIFSGDIDFFELFRNKLVTFLGYDSAAVFYNGDAISQTPLYMLSNIFYYFLVIASIVASIRMQKVSPNSVWFIFPLFVIGLTLAQMLVEVAARYHYSIIPFLIIIAQFGLFYEKKSKFAEGGT